MQKNKWALIMVVIIVVIVGIIWYVTPTKVNAPSDGVDVSERKADMTFFLTSANPGDGANLGGLAGADQYCQRLADTNGAGEYIWRAYLSATATDSTESVDARDRIGTGPWHNFNGELIANDVDELHNQPMLSKALALSETGEVINGRGDTPNRHDILTGSQPDGRVAIAEGDTTCANWTSATEGSAIVGHHDRIGLDESDEAKSWNASHGTRGCDLPSLNSTGGDGLFYCFATGK